MNQDTEFASSTPKVRIFLVIMVPITIVLSAAIYYFYSQELKIAHQLAEDIQQMQVAEIKSHVLEELEHQTLSVIVLSEHNGLETFISDDSKSHRVALEGELSRFVEIEKEYDQIRYIDENGEELVRVDKVEGGAKVSPQKDLQNKSDRYYFNDTSSLAEDTIYISPLDLNIENNSVENPIKPMIRFVSPVFLDNKRKGILIVNYEGQDLLSIITGVDIENESVIEVVNSDGYWLYSDDNDKNWGFMYAERIARNMIVERPALWSELQENRGQFYLDDDLYTFETIDIPKELNSVEDLKRNVVSSEDLKWRVVSRLDSAQIIVQPNRYLASTLSLVSIVYSVVLFAVWFLASLLERKRVADQKEGQLNKSLKLLNKILRHDILNHLTVIKYSLEALQEDESKSKDILKDISRSTEAGIQVISDMKELEQNVTTEGELVATNLKKVVDGAVQRLIKEDKIEVVVDGDAQAMVDQGFRSVSESIIRNVLMHSEATRLDIYIDEDLDGVEVTFADNGKGIPEEDKPYIFDEGFKSGDTGNTGLGLYIVKTAVERYGGEVVMSDNKPQGTKFVVRLPRAEK